MKNMLKKHGHFGFIVGVVLITMLSSKVCYGFALSGPSSVENASHGNADPGAGFLQPFDAGFRWSFSDITYSIDSTFTTAFGTAGADTIRNAFCTWDKAFGTTDAPTSTHINKADATPGFNKVDLESVALHEIGHSLGLTHPDAADDFNFNFDTAGTPISSSGNEVMNEGRRLFGEVQRALTQDDIDGLNHLYSTTNAVPTLKTDLSGTVDTFGPGDLGFSEALSSIASIGGTVGANIDIFAQDLGSGPSGTVRAQTFIYGGSSTAGGSSFASVGLGGFFDGVPLELHSAGFQNPNHGNTLMSIDIIFNTNFGAGLGINPFVTSGWEDTGQGEKPIPEPATIFMLGTGLVGIVAFRFRNRFRKK